MASTRRRPRRDASSDPVLTLALVVLALIVGAFVASAILRWSGPPPPASQKGQEAVGGSGSALDGGLGVTTLDRGRIRIEVLNGARVPGLADRMTELLRSRGFDVVNYGNAPGASGPTAIVDRVGNPRIAREVALALPGVPIRRELAPDGLVDVTVIVGEDYERFFKEESMEHRAEPGSLRRAAERIRAILGI